MTDSGHRFFKEAPVLFLIGPTRQEFHVHPGVLKPISEKLYKQTQPGWKEYESGVVLAQFEPQTFVRFAEYAYTGNYVGPLERMKKEEIVDFAKPFHGLLTYTCRWGCISDIAVSKTLEKVFPFCSENCKQKAVRSGTAIPHCAKCRQAMGFRYPSDDGTPALCLPCQTTQKAMKSLGTGSITKTSASGSFNKLQISLDAEADHAMQEQALAPRNGIPTDDLVAHAKLYHFADYNLVSGLTALCLQGLHRDLLEFVLTKATVGKIVELLEYTYENTEPEESPSTVDQDSKITLRRLVILYTIGMAKELMMYEEFATMLARDGDLMRDFLTGVSKRLP